MCVMQVVTEEMWAGRSKRFPEETPSTKEYYLLRSIFEEHFPSKSALDTVPKVIKASILPQQRAVTAKNATSCLYSMSGMLFGKSSALQLGREYPCSGTHNHTEVCAEQKLQMAKLRLQGLSIACSTPEAVCWDPSWANTHEISGRAMNVHDAAEGFQYERRQEMKQRRAADDCIGEPCQHFL